MVVCVLLPEEGSASLEQERREGNGCLHGLLACGHWRLSRDGAAMSSSPRAVEGKVKYLEMGLHIFPVRRHQFLK